MECFEPKTNTCRIAPYVKLRGVLEEALTAFIKVLDGYTLADVARMEGIAPLSNFSSHSKRQTLSLQCVLERCETRMQSESQFYP